MFRIFGFIFVLYSTMLAQAHGSTVSSTSVMARDLASILEMRSNIDNLSGTGRSYRAFTQQYLQDLDTFLVRYSSPFGVFALRPTIDRSLSYRLRIQDYSLSCEIAALRIILERLGVIVTERQILMDIPYFAQPYSTGGIWGDPDIEFVGYYTGGQAKQTGYGIYEAPLALYAQTHSLDTRIINQLLYTGGSTPANHLGELLSTLDDPDSHVILWGDWCTDPDSEDGFFSKGGKSILRSFPLPARNRCWRDASERRIRWQTPSGKQFVGLSGEHAYVLLGYIGKINNPTHIIVWDTYTGRHVYPYAEWIRKWAEMQYRSLIISQ